VSDPGWAGGGSSAPSPQPEPAPEPLVATALVLGGAKGALAGAILGFPSALFILLQRPPSFSILDAVRTGAGSGLALGCLCGLEAASMRLAVGPRRRLTRFAAGFFLPFAAFAPQVGILQVAAGSFGAGAHVEEIALSLGAAGLLLGLAEVFAGEPKTGPHEAQGCGRLVTLSFLTGLFPVIGVAIAAGVNEGSAAGSAMIALGGLLGVGIYGSIAAGFVWIAENMAAPFVRPLARALEPELLRVTLPPLKAPKGPGYALDDRGVGALIAQANGTADEAARRKLFGDALERLEGLERVVAAMTPLLAESIDPATSGARARIERLRAEIFLGRGDLEAAEKLLPSVELPAALEIELVRRRGQPAKAAELAEKWLASLAKDQSPAARFARGNAHALLALARADEGRFDEATEHARTLGLLAQAAAFQHLNPRQVHAYVAAARERARRP
jgi:hypothetical protein